MHALGDFLENTNGGKRTFILRILRIAVLWCLTAVQATVHIERRMSWV